MIVVQVHHCELKSVQGDGDTCWRLEAEGGVERRICIHIDASERVCGAASVCCHSVNQVVIRRCGAHNHVNLLSVGGANTSIADDLRVAKDWTLVAQVVLCRRA